MYLIAVIIHRIASGKLAVTPDWVRGDSDSEGDKQYQLKLRWVIREAYCRQIEDI